MAVSVTVLGSSGGYAAAGRACSGYLLEREGASLVLDLGSGALANMLKYVAADRLDGLAITHVHYDHYVDLLGLCTARRFWESELPPLWTLLPSGAREVISCSISEQSRELFFSCLDVTEAKPGLRTSVGGFDITCGPARHTMESFAYRVEAGGVSICYTGDTDADPAIVELARGCDLFICEATFTSQVTARLEGHLFAREAGVMASEAGVGRLLLTHVWPMLSGERALADALEAFRGPAEVAVEGMRIDI